MRIVHAEFQSTDAKATNDFLVAMFDLSSSEEALPSGPLYTLQVEAERTLAVRDKAEHERAPGTTVYFEVDDIHAALTKARGHGAVMMVPKMTYAGRGYIAWVEAPGSVYMAFLQVDSSVRTTGEFE